jgi:hypothetical protein
MSLPSNQCCILVVVRDFDLVRVTVIPHKADPKLVVDSNCVLFPALAFETMEPICRRNPQIFESFC